MAAPVVSGTERCGANMLLHEVTMANLAGLIQSDVPTCTGGTGVAPFPARGVAASSPACVRSWSEADWIWGFGAYAPDQLVKALLKFCALLHQ